MDYFYIVEEYYDFFGNEEEMLVEIVGYFKEHEEDNACKLAQTLSLEKDNEEVVVHKKQFGIQDLYSSACEFTATYKNGILQDTNGTTIS